MDEHTLEPVDDEPVGNEQSDEGDRLDEDDPGDDPVASEPGDDELDEDDLPDEPGDDELDEDDLPDEPGDAELDADDLADEPDDELDEDDLVDGNAAAFSAAPHRDLADEHGDDDLATVAGGATIEEAKRKALEQLRKIAAYVNEAEVEFIVLDEGQKGGFLGMGRTQPRVEARLSSGAVVEPAAAGLPPAAGALQEFLEEVISLMGLDATIETSDTAEAVSAQITGDDLGILIGRHGQTLDALQYLAAIVVNGDRRQRRQVIVDAEGYRQRREVTLRALAERTAQKVSRDLAPVTLQPMTAAERKIIHLHLKDNPRVETASEGQEPNRAVVVSPRRRS